MGDAFLRLRYALEGPGPAHPSIVIVDLGDAAVKELGMGRSGRGQFARLIEALGKAGAAAVAVDVVFDGAGNPDEDAALAKAVAAAGNVYLPVIATPSGGLASSYAELDAAAAGLGHINAEPDPDGVYRRVPLFVRRADRLVPSLALRTAYAAQGVDPGRVGAGREPVIPTDRLGRLVIDYRGPWGAVFPHYPFQAVVASLDDPDLAEALADELEGAVVVVADVTTASSDYGPSPLEGVYPLAGIHAGVINSILLSSFLRDPHPALTVGLSLALALGLWLCSRLPGPRAMTAASIAAWAALVALELRLFLSLGLMPALAAPTAGTILFLVAAAAYRLSLAERARLLWRARVERYFAPSVMEKILSDPGRLASAERKRVTVLFSDIAGFTAWSSSRDPAMVHAALNDYFEAMTAIVFEHGGTVDKFIGDGLMAFFGDPIDQGDHELRAVHAAIDMQLALRARRSSAPSGESSGFHIRIGINAGEAIVGDLGSRRIMAYTAIGATVNLASRLEGKAPVDGILVSEPVYRAVAGRVPMLARGKTSAKGIGDEFETWEVGLPDA